MILNPRLKEKSKEHVTNEQKFVVLLNTISRQLFHVPKYVFVQYDKM